MIVSKPVMKKVMGLAVAASVTAIGAFANHASAGVISWNYDYASTIGGEGAGDTPPLTALAGVDSVGGWTNSFPNNITSNLRDDSGNPTTLNISYSNAFGGYSPGGTGHPGQDAAGTWNKELLNGFYNGNNGGIQTLSLTTIPYTNYEVIVYFNGDNGGRTGTLTDGTTSYNVTFPGSSAVTGNGVFTQATDSTLTGNNVGADYAIFGSAATPLTATSQTYSWPTLPNGGGFAAFQVVSLASPVPEPASLSLLGLGAASLLGRRRKA